MSIGSGVCQGTAAFFSYLVLQLEPPSLLYCHVTRITPRALKYSPSPPMSTRFLCGTCMSEHGVALVGSFSAGANRTCLPHSPALLLSLGPASAPHAWLSAPRSAGDDSCPVSPQILLQRQGKGRALLQCFYTVECQSMAALD